MFSRRLLLPEAENPLTLLRQSLGGSVGYDLTVSNPTRVGLDLPVQALREALDPAQALRYEPDPHGLLAAREALVAYYADAHGAHVHPDDVFLTASTSEAYAVLLKLLCDPGDAVAVPTPSYPLFEHLVALEGVGVHPWRLFYEGGWEVDLASVEDSLGPRTRALIHVGPNNPTGGYLRRSELDALEALCAPRQVPLINDEVFADYPLTPGGPGRVTTLAGGERPGLCFALGGLSKLLGLPQLKLSWIVLSGPEALKAEARRRLELICDSYLSVGTPVQVALPRLLPLRPVIQGAIQARIDTNLRALRAAFPPGSAAEVLRVDGGWSAIVRFPRLWSDEDVVASLLTREGVWLHPGHFFDLAEGHLVVGLLPLPDAFKHAAGRLAAAFTSGGALAT